MLIGLSIHDVVLIDHLDLSFKAGFSVLTGETGAGKSILLDSLGLALGMRGELGLIRQGAEQAAVTAVFDLKSLSPDHPVWNLLTDHGLENEDSTLILRRVLHRTDRGKAFINDQTVTIRTLREVGNVLLEIHSQFDRLFDVGLHQQLLDRFSISHDPLVQSHLEGVKTTYLAWKTAQQNLEAYQQGHQQGLQQQAFHAQVVADLSALKLIPNEEDSLLEKRQNLAQYGKISTAVEQALGDFYHPDPVAQLTTIQKTLERANSVDSPQLKEVTGALNRALIEIQEAQAVLRNLHHQDQDSVQALEQVDERLHLLRSFSKRYATPVNDLYPFWQISQGILDQQEQAADHLKTYQTAVDQAWQCYEKDSQVITIARQKSAKLLAKDVEAELPDLKLASAIFKVDIQPCHPTPFGADKIEFLIATNPGQTPASLNKVASGGELSRLMLALKVVLTGQGGLATIVFDEVDTGVGGAVTAVIGQRLAKLSSQVQVLAITHLPQVAAHADHHYCVQKQTASEGNQTTVKPLNTNERIDELARMVAGTTITPEALAMAKQLLVSTTTSTPSDS